MPATPLEEGFYFHARAGDPGDDVYVVQQTVELRGHVDPGALRRAVRAVVTRRKALAVQVRDHGIAMSEERLAEVTARLADPPDLDVSVSRRMGRTISAFRAR